MLCRIDVCCCCHERERGNHIGDTRGRFRGLAFDWGMRFRQARDDEMNIFVRLAERVFLLSNLPLYIPWTKSVSEHGGILYKYHPAHKLSCKTHSVTNFTLHLKLACQRNKHSLILSIVGHHRVITRKGSTKKKPIPSLSTLRRAIPTSLLSISRSINLLLEVRIQSLDLALLLHDIHNLVGMLSALADTPTIALND
jgi:hypothetical protein